MDNRWSCKGTASAAVIHLILGLRDVSDGNKVGLDIVSALNKRLNRRDRIWIKTSVSGDSNVNCEAILFSSILGVFCSSKLIQLWD